jgi:xanthine/CO dehydrogenase XdhC/CoxF family maturation factor
MRDVFLKGNKFFLATNSAAMLDASKSMATGLLNREGRLHLLNIRKLQGGTGEEVAAQMLECIEETGVGRILKEKIELLVTDQEAAQLKANEIIAAQLTSEDNEEAPKTLTCCMHSVSNCCLNSRHALQKVSPDAAQVLDDIKCVNAKPKKLVLLKELDDKRRESSPTI